MAPTHSDLPSFSFVQSHIPASFVPAYSKPYVTDSYCFGLFGECLDDVWRVHHFLYSTDSEEQFGYLTQADADQIVLKELRERGHKEHARRLQDTFREYGERYYKKGASMFHSHPCEEALAQAESSPTRRLVDVALGGAVIVGVTWLLSKVLAGDKGE